MNLIIGGAYQGKTEYAMARFSLKPEDIFTCQGDTPADFSKKCLRRLEEYARYALHQGREPLELLLEQEELWQDSVFVCDEISCGIVPMDAEERAWRESVGRMLCALTARAETVTRLFCGLPQVLK